jgi:hypothetical protein
MKETFAPEIPRLLILSSPLAPPERVSSPARESTLVSESAALELRWVSLAEA